MFRAWLGARLYDPSTRGFLSTDPLESTTGAGWASNPYSYAGNDPVHQIDPLGLSPVSAEELQAYNEGKQSQNIWNKAKSFGHSMLEGAKNTMSSIGQGLKTAGKWVGEHWEVIAGVAVAAAGVGLMFTGVGGPAGLALMALSGGMISGGASMASQELTEGKTDWSTVGKDSLVGALSGGLGAGSGAFIAMKTAGKTLSLGARATIGAGSGAAEGATSSTVEQLVNNDGDFSLRELGGATLAGALPGGVTAYKPKWLTWSTTKNFKYLTYRSGYSHKPEVLNRVGSDDMPWGQYWSHDVPQNLAQVRRDKALPLHWQSKKHSEGYDPDYGPTSYTMRYQAKFEQGTEMYTGIVAPQRDGKYKDMVYPGGTGQVFIDKDEWRAPRENEIGLFPQKGTILDSTPLPQ